MTTRLSHAVKIIVFGLVLLTTTSGAEKPDMAAVDYRVVELHGKLLRLASAGDVRVGEGDALAAGSEMRTGWWSKADLVHEAAGTRFHVASRTHFRLAGERPGVLLHVEKGRVRAAFDKLMGTSSRERLVTTPSAVLAVRGTEYGVLVRDDGSTELVVFEGVVEVADSNMMHEAVMVRAGHMCTIAAGQAPSSPAPHGMSQRGFDRGASSGAGGGPRHGSGGSMGSGGSPRGSSGGMGGMGG